MEKECPYLYKQVINNDRDSCDQLAKESLKAYSRLIAAAPDLLEALKETISELNRAYEWMLENNKMSDVISTQRKSTIEKGKAALAKAEGR